MEIKILGPGCARCHQVEKLVREAITEAGVAATVEKVTDLKAIVDCGVLTTPGLVINGQVKSAGRIPRKEEILEWLQA